MVEKFLILNREETIQFLSMLANDLNNIFTNWCSSMIGKIYFFFWSFVKKKKKRYNYFFADFIREDDISVLERGRDRIFRQFHVVYRYENTDRPSQNDVLLL